MCSPTIAAVAIGTAQAGMSIVGQRQAAKTQATVQRRAALAENDRLSKEYSSMRMSQAQERIAQAQRISAAQTKAREARATARVSAGEAGVAGISVDALINDMTRQEAQFNFAEAQQTQFREQGLMFGIDNAAQRSYMNQLAINKPIAQPNYLGAILSGAQTGLTFAAAGQQAGLFSSSTGSTAAASSAASPTTFNPNSAFNVQPLNYTPFTPPTTFGQ
jgi:multidrug efflux pump subunit AcrA (membrane-fusion protein)